MTRIAEIANDDLLCALGRRHLVTLDRFTSAGRTSTSGPVEITSASPVLTAGYYSSWPAVGSCRVLAYEERSGRRTSHTKHGWLSELASDITARCRQLPGTPVFAAWYVSSGLARIATVTRGAILAVPAAVRAELENKTCLENLLCAAGVPAAMQVPALSVHAPPSYAQASRRLGPRLVVQPALTSGGRGTQFVDDADSYATAVQGPGPWRIAQRVQGFSSNTTVLTVPTEQGCAVYVDQPSHKAVGITKIGIAVAKGAGNDWSPPWPHRLTEALVDALTVLGQHLYKAYGLVGLWGADTIWADDRLVINEINIRNQGTTELSGVNQVLRGLPPLLVAHLTILAGGRVSWLPSADDFNTGTIARTSTGGLGPYYLKLRNPHPYPIMAGPGWNGPGVYRLDSFNSLVWLRPGAHPVDADLRRREVLMANAPASGVDCWPGAELGTVEGLTVDPIFSGPSQLSALGQTLHQAALDRFVPFGEEYQP